MFLLLNFYIDAKMIQTTNKFASKSIERNNKWNTFAIIDFVVLYAYGILVLKDRREKGGKERVRVRKIQNYLGIQLFYWLENVTVRLFLHRILV